MCLYSQGCHHFKNTVDCLLTSERDPETASWKMRWPKAALEVHGLERKPCYWFGPSCAHGKASCKIILSTNACVSSASSPHQPWTCQALASTPNSFRREMNLKQEYSAYGLFLQWWILVPSEWLSFFFFRLYQLISLVFFSFLNINIWENNHFVCHGFRPRAMRGWETLRDAVAPQPFVTSSEIHRISKKLTLNTLRNAQFSNVNEQP